MGDGISGVAAISTLMICRKENVRVIWTPLTEDARLQVNVREKAEHDNTGINRNRYEEIK